LEIVKISYILCISSNNAKRENISSSTSYRLWRWCHWHRRGMRWWQQEIRWWV